VTRPWNAIVPFTFGTASGTIMVAVAIGTTAAFEGGMGQCSVYLSWMSMDIGLTSMHPSYLVSNSVSLAIFIPCLRFHYHGSCFDVISVDDLLIGGMIN
jgi:hypothetical protein